MSSTSLSTRDSLQKQASNPSLNNQYPPTAVASDKEPITGANVHSNHPLNQLSSGRKHFLLFIFCLSNFVDVCNVSGVAIATSQIAADIKLAPTQIVWIITAYSLSFASFLLFAGRLADLVPAQYVFEVGFFGLGVFSLVQSFVTTNKYAFLIIRALGGIMGAMTIPSGYHMTGHMFPHPLERRKKIALLGLAGALGNVLGLVLAGLTMLTSYKWFFRLMAIISFTFSIAAIFLIPRIPSAHTAADGPRWKRLDPIGVILMCGGLACFILGLTQGPIDGWNKASFIAPFIISIFLAVGFFFYEAHISPKRAILPATVWKIKNMKAAAIVTLMPYSFWATSQLLYATFWQVSLRWKPLHVAAAILPQGIASLFIGAAVQAFPAVIYNPRRTIPVGAVLIMVANVLMYFSDGGTGMNYWKFVFPAFVLGSSGAVVMYMASGINLIAFCPPEMGGVAGAFSQALAQVGGAIGLAMQAGLSRGSHANWKRDATSYWYQLVATALVAVIYVVCYSTPSTAEEEHRLTRERIAELEENHAVKHAGVLPTA
ncbi:hypothetical protein Q8F55_004484 [Vanrija albida]|uniref:Major facilitator superfamily (MFS) profile domain-containing protein n=1 Tax=Vanrija albida TaxID=181172 RepID=A0ABR3Q722_9TREE